MMKLRWMIGVGLLVSVIGLLTALAMQPLWLLTGLSPLICPSAIFAVDTQQPVIALTIDDGPDLNPSLAENTTAAMLSLLERYQAHATFFLISNKLTTPLGATLAEAIVDHGHELGNHFTTDIRSIRPSPTKFAQGVQTAEQILISFTQPPAKPRWFRPAGGLCSVSNAETLHAQNYDIALGSIWPYDTHQTSVPLATRQILDNAQPGAIIILHDSDKTGWEQPAEGRTTRGQRSLDILETVLPTLQFQSFQVVSLSELIAYGNPIASTLVLPGGVDTVRRRLVSGLLIPSVNALPPRSSWGAIALIAITASVLMLWIGFHQRFLRWQWLVPTPPHGYFRVYARIITSCFFLPALLEETLFRLILLPTPEEIISRMTRGQWLTCVVSLGLFVMVHPVINGPLRDRIAQLQSNCDRETASPQEQRPPHQTNTNNQAVNQQQSEARAIAYARTFRQPTFLGLATILGSACTLMYLQSGSIWPSVCFHWGAVAVWLLGLGGDRQLHPPL